MSDLVAPQATFGDNLVRAVKLVHSMRHDAPRPHPEVDPLAYPVLFTLWCQPRRVSDLADKVYADISTVSRQVTHLVGLGLIERLPDPEDGRAHLLTLTPAGIALLTTLRQDRVGPAVFGEHDEVAGLPSSDDDARRTRRRVGCDYGHCALLCAR